MQSDVVSRKKIIDLIRSEPRPMAVGTIAKKVGLKWWSTFKLIADLVLEELQTRSPEALQSLSIVPLKTSKDWILVSPVFFQGLRKEAVSKT